MNIEFEIPNDAITHLKEVSFYDHNYYKIDKSKLNTEWFNCNGCDIIYEEYDEFPDRYTLTFGYFIEDEENPKFVPMLSFDSPYGIDELKEKGTWYEN